MKTVNKALGPRSIVYINTLRQVSKSVQLIETSLRSLLARHGKHCCMMSTRRHLWYRLKDTIFSSRSVLDLIREKSLYCDTLKTSCPCVLNQSFTMNTIARGFSVHTSVSERKMIGVSAIAPRYHQVLRASASAGGSSAETSSASSSGHGAGKDSSMGSMRRKHKELLEIKGVGPVNANLLLRKRITSIDHLQEIYHQVCKQDTKEFQEFLHNVVGFRNSAHSRSVADYLDNLEWVPQPARVKLAVEGNIGAGKSTFLDVLCDGTLELQDIIEIVPEPVEEWQKVETGEHSPVNLLDQFYKDPKRYAYAFQHYVLLTRMQKDRKARSSNKPLQILERSIFSDRMVFVRAMHEAGFLGDLELSIYDSWFSMQIGQDRALTPDGFIYLKARPETCIKRLRHRNRSEEAGVDEAYLENLHDKHESWLHFGARQLNQYMEDEERYRLMQTVSALKKHDRAGLDLSPQLAEQSSDGLSIQMDVPGVDVLGQVPPDIRDSIVFLGTGSGSRGEGAVDAALSGVPALVLDHEQEDILYDRDARQDYASKVMAFSNYVNSLRTSRQRIEVENTVRADEAAKLRELMSEYKKIRERHKRDNRVLEGNLSQIEVALQRLESDGRFGKDVDLLL